ncbi:uncharacterized protein LOC111635231 [Centruroides sculpturatus]|uniref:uncharacterized protein LOC111635231 n=1 Tax=Centruroides sculpturatus TaxID=218467 RepID=UPI000C6EF2B2|nr:uncharacterized protein LOC111635231 [Centruroides sculpturatus]
MEATTILVPLQPPHGCRQRLPIPRDYADHAGLVRHLKQIHNTALHFECRACGYIHEKLKMVKLHQARSDDCRASIKAATPPPPPPANRKKTRILYGPIKRRTKNGAKTTSTSTAANDSQSSGASLTPLPSTTPARLRTRRTMRSLRGPSRRRSTAQPNPVQSQPAPTTDHLVPSQESPTRSLPAPNSDQLEVDGSPTPTGRPTPHLSPSRIATPDPPVRSQTPAQLATPPSPPRQHQPVTPVAPPPAPQTSQPPQAPMNNSSSGPPEWALAWASRFESAIDEDILEGVLSDFIHLTYSICDIQGPRQPRSTTNNHTQDHRAEASEVQRLYRANRKRAVDRILGGNSRFCQVETEKVYRHFKSINEQCAPSTAAPVPVVQDPAPATDNPLNIPFTPEEVAIRIAKGHNTAPGPDRIRYLHWRRVDPTGTILAALFNTVLKIGYIPLSWRESTTVLIYKKGDCNNLNNWRPICLSNTLGKLYTACLADRLLRWCYANDRISTSQKGFLHYQGCMEHNFLLKTVIQDARRTRKECHVAWLDIANAFGSVPHTAIWKSLNWHGLHPDAILTLQRLYEGSTTRVRTSSGFTDPISMLSGVRQGCPISPLLFILTIEPAIRRLQRLDKGYYIHNHPISALAYADDIALISSSHQGLQDLLDSISEWADWANIRFNHSKCGTLSVLGKSHTTGTNDFFIKQNSLPRLGNDDAYKHLGVPTGFSRCDTEAATTDGVIQDINKLDASHLAPWQKVDALNTFILPRLSFCLATGTTPKKTLDKIDRTLKRHVKKWLGLPQRASAEILHLSYKQGGTNITPASLIADIAQVCHAVYLFNSRDEHITDIALGALRDVVTARIMRTPSDEELCHYLDGSMDGDLGNPSKDITSMWTRLRMATRRLKKKINIHWAVGPNDTPTLAIGDIFVRVKGCQSVLVSLMRDHHLRKLLAKPDQGKVFQVTASNKASNHFMNNGRFTRFTDWRFIHKARLSVVALTGHKRFGNESKTCRRCGFARETLSHVLCHCPPNFRLITQRHNAVLNRIVAAFQPRGATVLVNQRVPGFEENCRPDLTVIHKESKTDSVIDVTTPFENGQQAFDAAREEKERKYSNLVHLRNRGYNTHFATFIIGALGGYDSLNEATLQRLGIGRRYSALMKKLMVSDVIRISNDIYRQHLGARQQQHYQPPTRTSNNHSRSPMHNQDNM